MGDRANGGTKIRILKGDITDLEIQAFVYDITEDCKLGAGYGTAITGRAGKVVQDALDEIGMCPTGTAIATTAGKLKAEHIIYTNGPKFHEPATREKLQQSVVACLEKAGELGVKKIAFPPIGTGLYQVPLDLCAEVMVDSSREFLRSHDEFEEIVFVALNNREYEPFERKLGTGV